MLITEPVHPLSKKSFVFVRHWHIWDWDDSNRRPFKDANILQKEYTRYYVFIREK